MDRAFQSGASATPPTAPASPSVGHPTGGNPGTGTQATKPGPWWYHMMTEELLGIVEGAGLTPDQEELTQIASAIQSGALFAAAAAGTADALTASYTPAVAALRNGMSLRVRAGVANATTTPTFTPHSGTIADKTIVKGSDTPLVAGDIAGPGHWLELQYDLSLDKWVLMNPANGISIGSGVQTAAVEYFARRTAPTGFLKANGAAVSRTTYAALFAALVQSSNVTISIATPGVIGWTSHGRIANDPVKLGSTGSLPTGLTGGVTYYVVGASITANTFQVSAAPGGAAIATSGGQTGTHTAISAPYGDGDGSTTFNVPEIRGEFIRGLDDGRGVDAGRALGSGQLDQVQGHGHNINKSRWSGSGYGNGSEITATTQNVSGGDLSATTVIDDGVNGTARVGSETRPRNVALLACIKY